MGLKPSTVEHAKFEYSPLGKVFNKGLEEEEEKEGLLKRLKMSKVIEKKQLDPDSKSLKAISYFSQLSKGKELCEKIKKKKI